MKRRDFIRAGIAASAGAAAPIPTLAGSGPVEIPDYTRDDFLDCDNVRRAFYWTGAGPPVMILHELFGLSPDDLAFGKRLAQRGFTVYMPVLFGIPNHPTSAGYSIGQALHVCVSREFAVFSAHQSSPITASLRSLGTQMFHQHGGHGIGVIGLCLTGNFALAMMADQHLVAPVLSEPALPFGLTPDSHRSLHLSDDELACVKQRAAEGVTYLGFRFKGDCLSPVERFDRLEHEVGKASFERYDLKPSKPGAHAVLTADFEKNLPSTLPAFERLVGYLKERLGPSA